MNKFNIHIKDFCSFFIKFLILNDCLDEFSNELRINKNCSIVEFITTQKGIVNFPNNYENVINYALDFSATSKGFNYWLDMHYKFVKTFKLKFNTSNNKVSTEYKSIW